MVHRKDKIEIKANVPQFDEDGRLIYPDGEYRLLSDACFIEQSSIATERTGADGLTYTYSFVVHCPIVELPKKGDKARLIKADGSLETEMEVQDAFMYPNIGKVRIWL